MKRITYKELKELPQGTEFSAIIGGGRVDYSFVGVFKDYVVGATKSDCPPFFKAHIIYDWEHKNCQSVDNIFLIGEYDDVKILAAIRGQLKEIEEQATFQYR